MKINRNNRRSGHSNKHSYNRMRIRSGSRFRKWRPSPGLLGLATIAVAAFLIVIIGVPALMIDHNSDPNKLVREQADTDVQSQQKDTARGGTFVDPTEVTVYLHTSKQVITIPLEQYVRGVVAAEMPAEFNLEALKAQAIAARTYIARRLSRQDKSGVPDAAADVTDTVQHQAYLSDNSLRSIWGQAKYEKYTDKLDRAVNETQGVIITYQNEPIQALFFSTSNGYTENSEDYWSDYFPYLRSVPSPWDREISPKYENTVTMPYTELAEKLDLPLAVSAAATTQSNIVQVSKGHRIMKLTIAGHAYTGREVREKLGLSSSQFSWTVSDGMVTITAYGSGHGVGMSQWGANGLAGSGKTAESILKYYYRGVELEQFGNIALLQKKPDSHV